MRHDSCPRQEECRQLLAEETQRTRELEAQIAATEVNYLGDATSHELPPI